MQRSEYEAGISIIRKKIEESLFKEEKVHGDKDTFMDLPQTFDTRNIDLLQLD